MTRERQEGTLECPEFDLAMTLGSGQTFHWTPLDGGYTGCIGTSPIFLRQEETRLYYRGSDKQDLPALLRHYFAFDHDLESIRDSCNGHPPSYQAAIACKGLRIMRQPHWECIANFILSPMKQVAHIRKMSLSLRTAYGNKLPGTSVHSFPEPGILAATSEEELRTFGLGFRAKSLLGTARLIAEGKFDPESITGHNTIEARRELCTLPGVGRKVANCILLFSYERLDAVPVDVWIKRILESFRSRRSGKATPEQLERYGEKLLGPYAGYIQQFLFHQARTGDLTLPEAPCSSPRRGRANSLTQKTRRFGA